MQHCCSDRGQVLRLLRNFELLPSTLDLRSQENSIEEQAQIGYQKLVQNELKAPHTEEKPTKNKKKIETIKPDYKKLF